MTCYCDEVPASVYVKTIRKARKQHLCHECAGTIMAGERYEHVFGVWEGVAETYDTCCRCLDLREYTKSNVPCLCWNHQNMIEECIEALREYSHELPGLLFAGLRKLALIKRHKTECKIL